MGTGMLTLGLVEVTAPLWSIELAALSIGAGLGLCGGPVIAVAVANVPRARAGTASGLGNTARILGATLGVAVLGAIYAARAGQGVADPALVLAGVHAAFRGSAASAFAGAVVSWICFRRGSLEPVLI
jgi:DHA2 family methylenomycin A resistance protein-like MFS transporter